MNIYLVRHGDALMADEDPERPLSEEGREEISRLAEKLEKVSLHVDHVLHSQKTRAKETAQLLCSKLFPELIPEETIGLLPDDPISNWISKLGKFGEDVMLVGHLPFMGLLTHALLKSDQVSEITFVTGTVIWIEKNGDCWKLNDVFHP